jgi:hypothetical protein
VQWREDTGALGLVDQVQSGGVLEVDPTPDDAVDAGGPPGDRRGEQRAAGSQDARSLADGGRPVGFAGQVVQRAKEQHRVGRRVREVELSRVADGGADPRHPGGVRMQLADVQRHQIAVLDLVAERR